MLAVYGWIKITSEFSGWKQQTFIIISESQNQEVSVPDHMNPLHRAIQHGIWLSPKQVMEQRERKRETERDRERQRQGGKDREKDKQETLVPVLVSKSHTIISTLFYLLEARHQVRSTLKRKGMRLYFSKEGL